MNGTGDPNDSPVQGQGAAAGQQDDQVAPSGSTAPTPDAKATADSQVQSPNRGRPPAQAQPGESDMELLYRFLVGILVFGSDEFMQRVRETKQDIDETYPDYAKSGADLSDASTAELLRYLTVGLLGRGQRKVASGVRRGFQVSLSTTSWFFGKLDRLTDNSLARPVRRPMEARLKSWGRQAGVVIREGHQDEVTGRLLAQETIGEITDDMIDWIAQNPELMRVIKELIGQQSVGIAGTMMDNARQVTVVSDDAVESVVRKLLRRAPRSTLPPSPLAGQSQDMYAPETAAQVVDHDSK